MKKFLLGIFVVCALSVVYVTIRVETLRLCYCISSMYKEKDRLYAQKQYALCQLLKSVSPENVEQRIALENDNLGFNMPSKVVLVDVENCRESVPRRLTWKQMLFGEKQALAESVE